MPDGGCLVIADEMIKINKSNMLNIKVFTYLVIAILFCSCLAPSNQTTSTKAERKLYDYDIEAKLADMNIELPTPKSPSGANIVRAVRSGNLLFLSGKGPSLPNGKNVKGKLGADLDTNEGYDAAKLVAINQLGVLKAEVGDLNKVVRLVKVFGMVNAVPDYTEHSQVINGFSDLMIEVFGERGKHARAAVGMSSLPGDIAVEVDLVVEVRD